MKRNNPLTMDELIRAYEKKKANAAEIPEEAATDKHPLDDLQFLHRTTDEELKGINLIRLATGCTVPEAFYKYYMNNLGAQVLEE